ncbi:transcriptional regulator [Tenacibaculum discolor]|uniref:Transcriptional regulator n=1 Tax=Tenacibaculum discolor TaxID=361581 RepID=A0A2G1BU56_9FLAO|nr:transcriptional regulator [Tenacibaculum discolor]
MLFGKNFRKIRKSKNYTQSKLAIDINSDISHISRIERGLTNTTVIKLKEVSKLLSVPIEEFFNF